METMNPKYMNNNTSRIFQVSTLQALAMGYTKKVITVGELNTGQLNCCPVYLLDRINCCPV